jgi:hypothetical protein
MRALKKSDRTISFNPLAIEKRWAGLACIRDSAEGKRSPAATETLYGRALLMITQCVAALVPK